MAVYTGSSVSSLSSVCSNDDGGDGNCSRCSFSATSGRTYYIAVAGYSSTGSVALNWSVPTGSTGGDANWYVTTADSCAGGSSVRSGDVDDCEETWLQATGASGSGIVTFRWKVSSEQGYDWIDFYVDGVLQMGRSGTGAGWRQEAFVVGSGTHTFKWVYNKDCSVSRGSDCAWVDKVTWTAGSPLVPVYRFYSSAYRGHFYTSSTSERNNLIRTNPSWNYEGVAWYTHPTQASGTSALHRFYSSGYRAHFFTRNQQESDTLRRTNRNWRYEGVSGYVRASSGCGSTPVYRFWSARYRHHFYTANQSECESLRRTNPNWKYEGVAFYAWSSPENLARECREAEKDGEPVAKSAPAASIAAAWTLAAADGTPVEADGVAEIGDALVETSADAPDATELAAAEPADPEAAAVALRLSLPGGAWTATLWSAAEGAVSDGSAVKEFAFEIPADGTWHWLRVLDADGGEAFSRWIRAE
jgi:hypothetical protein